MVERTHGNLTFAIRSAEHTKIININIIKSSIVNHPPSASVGFTPMILPILVSILVVNILSILLISRRESTLVNRLLTLDCIANALSAMIGSIQQSEANIAGVEVYCASISVVYLRCFVMEQTFFLCKLNNE